MTNKGLGAEGGTRTPTSYLTRPSNVRVYQFRHFGSFGQDIKNQKRFTSSPAKASCSLTAVLPQETPPAY